MTQYFVIYGLKSEGRFREEFDHAFGLKPQVNLSFSRPPADVEERYAAGDPDDVYLTVKPRQNLSAGEQERVISAVQTAARAAGTSFCPVR